MYDDCCDITMYPLQMVLPLISQHVGASQSSTIGNNGSSRAHPPHYHLNHTSQNGHVPASSRLTTLSQHLPVEILNCIQPTLNQLANSLVNASKDSKVTSGSGGSGGNSSSVSCNGKQCSSTSSSSPTPNNTTSSIPPAMSNFPPLVKTQRAPKSSTGGTPRKTWQNCATAELSPSLVNNAEYPQLCEVLSQKCKLPGTGQSQPGTCQTTQTQMGNGQTQSGTGQSQPEAHPPGDVCQKGSLLEKSCQSAPPNPIQCAKLKKTDISAHSFGRDAGDKSARTGGSLQENSVKVPDEFSQSKLNSTGVSESFGKSSREKFAAENRSDGPRCLAPDCVLRNNVAKLVENQRGVQHPKSEQESHSKDSSSRANAVGNGTCDVLPQGGNATRTSSMSDNHSANIGSAAKYSANQNSRIGKCKLGACCDSKCICCTGRTRPTNENVEMGASPSSFDSKGKLNTISGGKVVRKKTNATPGREKGDVTPLSPVTQLCDTVNSTVIKQDSNLCTNHVKNVLGNNVQSDDDSTSKSSETRRSYSKTSCIDVNSVQKALHLVENTLSLAPSRVKSSHSPPLPCVNSEMPSLPRVHSPAQSDDNCDINHRESCSSQDNNRSTGCVQSNCTGYAPCGDSAESRPTCSEQRADKMNGNRIKDIRSDMKEARNNHVRSDAIDRSDMIENRGQTNGQRSDVNGYKGDTNNHNGHEGDTNGHKGDTNAHEGHTNNLISDIYGSQGDVNGHRSDANGNRSKMDGRRCDDTDGPAGLTNGSRSDSNEPYSQKKHDRDSPSSHSSPSDSSGHSNKENSSSKYNRSHGDAQHHYHYNGYYHSNGYHGYNNNGYHGRNQGSLQSSRTNSCDDLKTNERYYDNRDFRHSNGKLSDNGGGWQTNRHAFSSSTSPVRYNSGGYGRGYQGRENRGSGPHERGGNKGGNQLRRPRFAENKNYNGGSNNYNTRHWVNNYNNNRDVNNYSRGHYYNNNHHYNNNNNNRNYRHNNSGYNNKNHQYYSPYGSLEDFPSNKPDRDSTKQSGSAETPAEIESTTPDLDRDAALTPSEGARGSSSSLSSCSNHSGPEGKSLKRHYNTTPGPAARSHKSLDPLPPLRTNRPLSPFDSHHLHYVQNKRRNTSGPSSGGGAHQQYTKPTFPPGPWVNPPLLNSPLGRHFSQRRHLGPDINFYTPALASLAIQQGASGAPLLPLGPPPLVTSYASTMLTELPWHVPEFETWDPLSKSIWTRYLDAQQTDTRFRQKLMLTRAVEEYVRFTLREPQFRLFLVGSTMSGFGTDTSDVDMCLGIRPYEFDRTLAIRVLYVLENNMHYFEIFKKAELIHAKVPILKFQDCSFKLEVDLNCNNVVGVRNTHLLYCYAQMDWRIRPLVLLVKLWARVHNINDAKNMTISSYSFTLMVLHFLQCGPSPPVLPNLMAKYPTKFSPTSNIDNIQLHEQLAPYRSSNEESLGALLTQFFHYYAHFEYFEYAISVRRGTKIPIEECRNHKSQRNKYNQWKYLCIEEPFDLTNTARSVYNLEVFEHIRGVIRKCSSLLEDTQDLNSIFEPLS